MVTSLILMAEVVVDTTIADTDETNSALNGSLPIDLVTSRR
jgi:hypothetical protein